MEFIAVHGAIKKSFGRDETNAFHLSGFDCQSPEYKLNIDVADITKLLTSKSCQVRLIISVIETWDKNLSIA